MDRFAGPRRGFGKPARSDDDQYSMEYGEEERRGRLDKDTSGRQIRSVRQSLAADTIIADAVARQHYEDAIAFVRRKRSAGQINEEEFVKLLAAGATKVDATISSSTIDHAHATSKILQLVLQLHPELANEVSELSATRGWDETDGRVR